MSSDNQQFRYTGDKSEIFKLGFKTAFLTLITLGIYRFWAKTRVRKYVWSSTELDGGRFEYTGTGVEKLLGFLIAIVFLAVYVGLIQMALFFFGLRFVAEPRTQAEALAQIASIYITFFALVPFLLFAYYRARRYQLARTRWRGIRFGMEKGAWGFVLRAIGHYLLTLVTLGIMLPRQTFGIEKYMTDRMWFGDAKFSQGGKWTALYPALKHVLIGLVILIAGIALGAFTSSPVLGGIGMVVGYFWLIIGGIHYGVQSFAYLTNHKSIEGGLSFTSQPETKFVIKTYVVGGLIIGLGFAVVLGILGVVGGSVFYAAAFGGTGAIIAAIFVFVLYVAALLMAGAASLALIIQPVIAHYLTKTTVNNLSAVDAISQRAADTGADAEGFADALDIGGAI